MCAERGYIKLFKKFDEWEWYTDANVMRLFIHLLINANYQDCKWRGVTIKRGQLVTSVIRLAESLNLSSQNIITAIKKLESTNEINKQTTNKYTIITICKYDDYQSETIEDNDSANKQITNKQQTTNDNIRNKEIKNNNKLSKDSISETSLDAETESENKEVLVLEQPTPSNDKHSEPEIDFDGIISYFNTQTKGVFGMIRAPLSSKRKTLIKARIREHGKKAFADVIQLAYQSEFLKGQNSRGFTATFDWLILPTNFEKTLSGNYNTLSNGESNTTHQTTDKRRGTDCTATCAEEYATTF